MEEKSCVPLSLPQRKYLCVCVCVCVEGGGKPPNKIKKNEAKLFSHLEGVVGALGAISKHPQDEG
jgi:hypothetical protein